MLELNGLCNECAIKLQFDTYNVGQYADKIMFKMAYLIGNFNFTYLRICLIYSGYVSFYMCIQMPFVIFHLNAHVKKGILK